MSIQELQSKSFSKEDTQKVQDFLNFVTKYVSTNKLDVKEAFEYVPLYGYMIKNIVPKINSLLLEVGAPISADEAQGKQPGDASEQQGE